MSRQEFIVRKILKEKYPEEEVYYNYRPEWLINPPTGRRLELDIYYPNLNLAVEVQGLHHKTLDQEDRDCIKDEVCYNRNITLEKITCKKKSLRKFTKKYNLRTPKNYGAKSPRKGSKTDKYLKQTKKQIEKDRYRRAARAQMAESLANRERNRVR